MKKLPAGNFSVCYDTGDKMPRASEGAVIRSALVKTKKYQFPWLHLAELGSCGGQLAHGP